MALTVTEAMDVNVVLRWLLDRDDRPGEVEARRSAERLADKANKTLMAGLNSDRVSHLWCARTGRKQIPATPMKRT